MPHTDGPWTVGTTGGEMRAHAQSLAIVDLNNGPNLIAGVYGDVRGGEDTATANARLLAAAPLLLVSLEAAAAAIESAHAQVEDTHEQLGRCQCLLNAPYLRAREAISQAVQS